MSRFYFRILLRLSVIKIFLQWIWMLITIIPKVPFLGNLLQLLKERQHTRVSLLGLRNTGPYFQSKLAQSNKLSSHHLRLKRRYKWSFLIKALCENSMFFTKKEMFVIYLLSVFRNYFVHAMITKYEIISSRKLPLELQIIARDKTNTAFSYYYNQYCMLKKLLVNHLLNISTQIVTILY